MNEKNKLKKKKRFATNILQSRKFQLTQLPAPLPVAGGRRVPVQIFWAQPWLASLDGVFIWPLPHSFSAPCPIASFPPPYLQTDGQWEKVGSNANGFPFRCAAASVPPWCLKSKPPGSSFAHHSSPWNPSAPITHKTVLLFVSNFETGSWDLAQPGLLLPLPEIIGVYCDT